MSNAHADNGHDHGPTLDDIVLEETVMGTQFTDAMEKRIDHFHVPLDKDKKPDMKALIEHIIHETGVLAEQHLKANPKYDASRLPGYDAIKNQLETVPDAVENGHLTPRGKAAITNLYRSFVRNNVEERGQTRYQAASLEESRPSAVNLANRVSDKYLKPLIDSAKTAAEVAARARTAVSSAYEKALQWMQVHGNMKGYQEAYAGAPAHH